MPGTRRKIGYLFRESQYLQRNRAFPENDNRQRFDAKITSNVAAKRSLWNMDSGGGLFSNGW